MMCAAVNTGALHAQVQVLQGATAIWGNGQPVIAQLAVSGVKQNYRGYLNYFSCS
jgi:hypothetical protein